MSGTAPRSPSPVRRRLFAAALACVLAGCGPSQEGGAGVLLPDLAVESVGPTPIVRGTRLVVRGSGFVPAEVAETTIVLRGTAGGESVELALPAVREDDETLSADVTGDAADALLTHAPGVLEGELLVQRSALADGTFAEASLAVSLGLEEVLAPDLELLTPTVVYPGDTLLIQGDGFLHPSEGVSLVAFDGTFSTSSPPAVSPIPGLLIPAVPPDAQTRDQLELVLTPDIFGVRPGVFEGTLQVWNQSNAGDTSQSASWEPPEGLVLEPPVVDAVNPTSASRGQRVDFEGRGLLPADGLLQAGSLLVLEGTFDPDRGPLETWIGPDAMALFPDEHVGNDIASVVLRVDRNLDGDLVGLGHEPGWFEGAVTPLVFSGADSVLGPALPLTFRIEEPRQMVVLKFLAAFDDALVSFGLLEARQQVIDRILTVTARDYEGINIGFVTEPPTDFVEYGIVEIGGEDPNGSSLFGLDNTAGKDVGNIRFDDVIGGFNAETRARGFAAYGGIFPAELLELSPTLSDIDLASPRFDDIFADLAPELGGTEATADEVAGTGPRAEAVAEAIRVLGNLVGNTVTHEVGHSLGLANIDGQFHNIGDNPGWIMDAGVFRPFEERAEIDGIGPAVFSDVNREYLEQILPVPK